MSKKVLKASLGRNSFGHLANELRLVRKNIEDGAKLGVKEATERLYNKVIENCQKGNIVNHLDKVHYDYDSDTNTGRVWTDEKVILFNEFGFGVVGKNNQHDWSEDLGWKYDVNEHGDKGWIYYNKEKGFFGHSKGENPKRMFYNAFLETEEEFAQEIMMSISRTI